MSGEKKKWRKRFGRGADIASDASTMIDLDEPAGIAFGLVAAIIGGIAAVVFGVARKR